jgi:hypothetical protein
MPLVFAAAKIQLFSIRQTFLRKFFHFLQKKHLQGALFPVGEFFFKKIQKISFSTKGKMRVISHTNV